MAKAELKTKPTDVNVEEFLNGLADEQQRTDSFGVLEIFRRVTGEEPRMWGPAIVGFGNHSYFRSDGREIDWLITGFAPRKGNITLYVLNGAPNQADLLHRMGKHKASGGCLHIRKLSDIDEDVLESLVRASVEKVKSSGT